MLKKRIDFEWETEGRLHFRHMPQGKSLAMVGGLPVGPVEEKHIAEKKEETTPSIVQKIIDSLENSK